MQVETTGVLIYEEILQLSTSGGFIAGFQDCGMVLFRPRLGFPWRR